jgi:two-component system chemotaxis response regulator CheB
MPERRPIRVLVVDDSAVMRKLLTTVLSHDPDVEVVATAVDGVVALQKLVRFQPDVVTLDLEMPRMDGMDFLKQTVTRTGPPVLVVSAHTQQGAAQTIAALEEGAVDVVAKPRDVLRGGIEPMAKELLAKVRAVAGRRWRRPSGGEAPRFLRPRVASVDVAHRVVAIGVSTGGPAALGYVLPRLPPDLDAAVVVVQHMPEGFTAMLAERLNLACALPVREAQNGEILRQGRIYVAQGGRHLRISSNGEGPVLLVGSGSPFSTHCPSADVLLQSAAAVFGAKAIGVLLTGMGDDGALGMESIHRVSGPTIAQDEESSVVFGMPRAAIQRGVVDQVLPLERIPEAIVALVAAPFRREAARKTAARSAP